MNLPKEWKFSVNTTTNIIVKLENGIIYNDGGKLKKQTLNKLLLPEACVGPLTNTLFADDYEIFKARWADTIRSVYLTIFRSAPRLDQRTTDISWDVAFGQSCLFVSFVWLYVLYGGPFNAGCWNRIVAFFWVHVLLTYLTVVKRLRLFSYKHAIEENDS